MIKFKVGDKVKIPTKKNADNRMNPLESCSAISNAKNANQNYLVICEIKDNNEITVGLNINNWCSTFLNTDLELLNTPFPQPFSIKGKKNQINSIIQDLIEIGYVKDNDWDNWNDERCVLINTNNVNGGIDDFKRIVRINSNKDVNFSLPEQYSEALQFAKEQLKHDYWNKDEITKVKKGDYLYCIKDVMMNDNPRVIEANLGKIYISEFDGNFTNENENKYHGLKPVKWINEHFRKATPEEIEQYKNNQIKIGTWEAKIDNKTVSFGCKKNITLNELKQIKSVRDICNKYAINLNFDSIGQIEIKTNEQLTTNVNKQLNKLIEKLS